MKVLLECLVLFIFVFLLVFFMLLAWLLVLKECLVLLVVLDGILFQGDVVSDKLDVNIS